MDAVDVQILSELMADAQTPFSRIAKKIGVSHETVRKKYARMKKEGTIKQDVLESLKQIPDLYMIIELIGDYDFFAWARLKNMQQLAQLVGDIRDLGNIDRMETLLLTQTYFTFSLAPKVAIKCNGMDLPKRP
jgi:DNA-binding Lrp family transcriptional regulator